MTEIKDKFKDIMGAVDKELEVEKCFMVPLSKMLLEVKLVDKVNDRKLQNKHVQATILLPHDIVKGVGDVISGEWNFIIMGFYPKKKKSSKASGIGEKGKNVGKDS
jgi:hypothetical protein